MKEFMEFILEVAVFMFQEVQRSQAPAKLINATTLKLSGIGFMQLLQNYKCCGVACMHKQLVYSIPCGMYYLY